VNSIAKYAVLVVLPFFIFHLEIGDVGQKAKKTRLLGSYVNGLISMSPNG